MKKYYFLIFITAFFSCRNDGIDPNPIDENYINLHDTLLALPYIWSDGSVDFNLDLDKDSINDVKMTVYRHYSSFAGSESYLQVTPMNKFKIAFTNKAITNWSKNPTLPDTLFTIDTVSIPQTFHTGDTLTINDRYSTNSQMISYSYFPTGPGTGYYSNRNYSVQENSYFYLGFCTMDITEPKLAWLKIKYLNNEIILNSSNYKQDKKFIIEEKL